jgi:hypothetical protein
MKKRKKILVQHGANKHTIPNGAKAENINLLTFECVTFDFRAAVLVNGNKNI